MVSGARDCKGEQAEQGITAAGRPDPTLPHISQEAAILNTAILVFREGLESILVLAAITASFVGANQSYRHPVTTGAVLGLAATAATWFIAIAILDEIDAPALDIQAATGLLAVVVLLIVMNWFFHKVYWTGWISLHAQRRRELMAKRNAPGDNALNISLPLPMELQPAMGIEKPRPQAQSRSWGFAF